jgi:hypothetical protein
MRKKMKSIKKNLLAIMIASLLSGPILLRAAFEVRTIKGPEDLPEKFSSLAQKGDILLADGKYFLLIGASPRLLITSSNYPTGNAMGSLLGFIPAAKSGAGDLNIGGPVLRFKDKTRYVVYNRLDPVKTASGGQNAGFEATGIFEDKEGRKAGLRTVYVFSSENGQVDITTTITNTGKTPLEDLSYGLFFDAYHRYYFNPYDEERSPNVNFRVYQKKGHYLGWINLNPVEKDEEDRYPGHLGPGDTCTLHYILLADSSPLNLLQRIYQILDVQPVKASVAFEDFAGEWMEFIVLEAVSSAVFYRAALSHPLFHEFLLPPGVYRFQANFFPAVVEKIVEIKTNAENSFSLQSPPLGTVNVRIKNSQGAPVPGKVTFLGLAPTKSPYFEPDNPVETGQRWEGFKNSCFPGEEGANVRLPVGTYLASASRGPEYTIAEKVVEIMKEENRDLVFVIDRAVETPGLIALDPHMHTSKSDGTPSVSERIKSVVAEGIEVMVATDHNYITDYSMALRDLKLEKDLIVIPGSEVTTPDVIHYNTYPMEIRPAEMGNGAINASSDTASPLFAASRQKNPQALLQVNHPRAGDLGYFNNSYLDQESAASALTTLDTGFDLLEVLNGPYFYFSNQAAIEDWFHLLNRGYLYAIVGSSDSHRIDGGEPGYSRTYVDCSGEKGVPLDRDAFLLALKKGRSFVTNGPIISLKVNGPFTSGDLVKAPDGKVEVRLEARSAPWVAIDEVRLVFNGKRRIIFPVQAKDGDIIKFEQAISLTLAQDTYICMEAFGRKTLFPVLQDISSSGSLQDGTLPYALTNPVFVDVDGNGRFDPPLPEKIRLTTEPSAATKKISRS